MKNFLASFFGTLSAFAFFLCAGLFCMTVFLGLIFSLGNGRQLVADVEPGSFLAIDLGVNITDKPPSFENAFLEELFSNSDTQTVQLRALTRAIGAAAGDARIRGIYLSGSLGSGGRSAGFAALAELRGALRDFKRSGKPVIAFLETGSLSDYYVMSAADEVTMDPYGILALTGLAVEPTFYGGLFERFGVGVQVSRSGDYKSFAEPFVRRDLSPENRAQLQALADDIWGGIVRDVSADRDLGAGVFQGLVDGEVLIQAERALEAGLVSRVEHGEAMSELLRGRTGAAASGERFRQISVEDYLSNIAPDSEQPALKRGVTFGTKIAIVYAEGAIVEGEGERDSEVGGDRFAEEIRTLREDDSVAAVVLRVNSPGGSASASEQIQRELRLTAAEKPVVVSMGSYAASGGYWISAYGNRIFAEESTVTGSIGVIGMQFDIKKLANDLGVTWDSVKTGKHADFFSISRPKTETEMAIYQRLIDWTYGEFLRKVAEGRRMNLERVRALAGGRVWSGREAVRNGLADEIGGLEAAINYAAKAAGIKRERVGFVEFPRPQTFAEWMESLSGRKRNFGGIRDGGILSRLLGRMEDEARVLEQFNDSRGVYLRWMGEVRTEN